VLIFARRFVNILFREQRLPIAAGWKKPNATITAASLNAIFAVIAQSSNWTFTRRCEDLNAYLGHD
jgi:hypothetical protein